MTNSGNQALQRAIDYLGAVEVAPRRYAFPSASGPEWRLTEGQGLLELDQLIGSTGVALNSHYDTWQAIWSDKLPAWWSPDRQYAWKHANRDGSDDGARYPTTGADGSDERNSELCSAEDHENQSDTYADKPCQCLGQDLITCDLITGEEIPA